MSLCRVAFNVKKKEKYKPSKDKITVQFRQVWFFTDYRLSEFIPLLKPKGYVMAELTMAKSCYNGSYKEENRYLVDLHEKP